jgi:L-rhamnose mutarotase
MSRRFCFALDLKNDPALIAEYRKYHEKIWPEITQSLKGSGIEDLEIYLLGTRMFMIMEVNQNFSFEQKAKADEQDPKVQAWESSSCGDSSGCCQKQSQARNGCPWKVFLS